MVRTGRLRYTRNFLCVPYQCHNKCMGRRTGVHCVRSFAQTGTLEVPGGTSKAKEDLEAPRADGSRQPLRDD